MKKKLPPPRKKITIKITKKLNALLLKDKRIKKTGT
jgi:hypothetical protein